MVERLRRSQDIADVLRKGRHRAGRLMAVHVRERDVETSGVARITVVASRKVGGAVARNRAKRLLREAARRLQWSPGLDVVLVARRNCAGSTMPAVLTELGELTRELSAATPGVEVVATADLTGTS